MNLGSPGSSIALVKDDSPSCALSLKDEEILRLRKRMEDQQKELNSKSIQLAVLQEQLRQQTESKLRTRHSRVPSDDFQLATTEQHEHNRDWGFYVSDDSKEEEEPLVMVSNKILFDCHGDGGVYTGLVIISSGLPHGFGKMIYDEQKRIYDGDWQYGRWHGFGRADFSNGDSYEGEYRFDQRDGEGKYMWSDGRVYEGMFKGDKKHGQGTLCWPEGAVYTGEFSDGLREGWGSYKLFNGNRCLESYTGEWKYGQYNGYGTCLWENGHCYKGEWRDSMPHGRGVETYADGTIRHEGQWLNDEPVYD